MTFVNRQHNLYAKRFWAWFALGLVVRLQSQSIEGEFRVMGGVRDRGGIRGRVRTEEEMRLCIWYLVTMTRGVGQLDFLLLPPKIGVPTS